MKKTTNSRKQKPPHLAALDMTLMLADDVYYRELARVQQQLRLIQYAYLKLGSSAAIILEGWDAAGKGGTIRCMSAVLDPRSFKVWPISAPRKYYLERHYLARFFERLPPNGAISVFDRSWYGRVLVERVEELATPNDWRRAYKEINEFERMLTDHGTRVVKVFLHITPDEQLRRFRNRMLEPTKRWKLSFEDFRNRQKWKAYEEATDDMFHKTSTSAAPWHAIPANCKKYARVTTLNLIAERLSSGIDLSPAELSEEVIRQARQHLGIDPSHLPDKNRRAD